MTDDFKTKICKRHKFFEKKVRKNPFKCYSHVQRKILYLSTLVSSSYLLYIRSYALLKSSKIIHLRLSIKLVIKMFRHAMPNIFDYLL